MGRINVIGKRCNFFFIYGEIETKPMVTERWYVMDLPFVHLATLQDKRSLNHHLTVSFFLGNETTKQMEDPSDLSLSLPIETERQKNRYYTVVIIQFWLLTVKLQAVQFALNKTETVQSVQDDEGSFRVAAICSEHE
jgi:hypothetical protein